MLKIPDHQVAGHEAGAGKLGPLVDDSGRFYKPLQSGKRGAEEAAFYESFSSNTKVPEHIRKYFPTYYGTKVMKASTGVEHPHIVLQDLASTRVNPSIMDIKIDSRTWGPEASDAYIAKCLERDRESTSVTLGFRLSGLQVFINDESGFYKPNRDFIHKIGPDDVRVNLRKFVSSNPSEKLDTVPDCSLGSSVYGGTNGILAQFLPAKGDKLHDIYPTYTSHDQSMFINGFPCKNPSNISTYDFKNLLLSQKAFQLSKVGEMSRSRCNRLLSYFNMLSSVISDYNSTTAANIANPNTAAPQKETRSCVSTDVHVNVEFKKL
ncbi:Inositol polyphosphate kinase [Artemisia annua]|uniref:Inositol polyphosphate multikinase n=1 Tax=Artemisia annua TaxID=35608 RepID=A0A2U1PQ36_ARTAN|nr:Inositol polyphosphate kinase [Artemisia annua]